MERVLSDVPLSFLAKSVSRLLHTIRTSLLGKRSGQHKYEIQAKDVHSCMSLILHVTIFVAAAAADTSFHVLSCRLSLSNISF